ncbi:MAG: adenosylmethionine--8-amino-7-oxononanoate transaminase [Deltaproteobacteria bacterium]
MTPSAPVAEATPPEQKRHERLVELDRRHLWHPFTQMQGWLEEEPLIVERAEGAYLYDTLGRRYLDGVSSLWVTVHGHRRPELDEAIRAQLGRVAHSTLLGLSSVPAIELAAELCERTPEGLSRVFYSDSGSSAVEIAAKIAFQHWKQRGRPEKQKFLALGDAYHGDTLGSVSLGGMALFHGIFRPLLFEALRAPPPYCYRCPLGKRPESCNLACAEEIEGQIARHAGELAAVIVEPLVQGAAGMIVQPPGWLRRVREACDRADVLLIADEVAVGFGRTGTMFACEQEAVAPDILCLAKGLTGGYLPLAATLTTEEIFQSFLGAWESDRTFFHGHTYTGNPLACAAALANLQLFDDDRTLERLAGQIERLTSRLLPLRAHPHVGEVRQRGFMVGIELVLERETRSPYPRERRVGHEVILEARRRGVVLRPLGDVVVLMPPFCLSDGEIDELARVTSESIDVVTR